MGQITASSARARARRRRQRGREGAGRGPAKPQHYRDLRAISRTAAAARAISQSVFAGGRGTSTPRSWIEPVLGVPGSPWLPRARLEIGTRPFLRAEAARSARRCAKITSWPRRRGGRSERPDGGLGGPAHPPGWSRPSDRRRLVAAVVGALARRAVRTGPGAQFAGHRGKKPSGRRPSRPRTERRVALRPLHVLDHPHGW